MTTVEFFVRAARGQCLDRFPCLADRARRSSLGLKLVVVLLHVVSVGSLFLLDTDLKRKTREQPWYTSMYVLLFLAALLQYFFTSCSSPGYVLDAMRAWNGAHATFSDTTNSSQRQSAPRNENMVSSPDVNQLGRNNSRTKSSSWLKLVMDLYPPGPSSRSWTCIYCNVIQPPRSRHCHDCDQCVLQYDHHCHWLGTCIGKGNHCRFWWYIFEETVLCIWTGMLYISFLRSNNIKAWWEEILAIVLLAALVLSFIFLLFLLSFHSYLALTNQTTYELLRRQRILYLRGIPRRSRPFSKGICQNLYTFCFSCDSTYTLEAVPSMEELEARARPYTCLDIISCRCC